MSARKLVFTSPLEPELVRRVADVDPSIEVVYPGELLAPIRYASDHPLPVLTDESARTRWDGLLDEAEILFDFGPLDLAPRLARRPNLRWIQGTSAGIGRLAERVGLLDSDIVVTTSSGVHARPLAEFALLAMLMQGKQTLRLLREQQAHHWERHAAEEIRGKVVCIVGLGKIGLEVARLAQALDARVVGVVRELRGRSAAELGVDDLRSMEELDELLPVADVVVLSAPHTALTDRLLDARRLALLQKTALIVNIARGDVLDEDALVDALRENRLGGAALDVFAHEPLPESSPLWDMPNVFVSPHSASTVWNENERITDLFCDNLERYLHGRSMLNVLDKELLY